MTFLIGAAIFFCLGWISGLIFCNACDRYVSIEPTYLPADSSQAGTAKW